MFRHPINNGVDKETATTPSQIQPNTLDLTLDCADALVNYCELNGRPEIDFVVLNETTKRHLAHERMELSRPSDPVSGHYRFNERRAYALTSQQYVSIPEGMIGWVVARSTLNRNGVQVISSIYDSGFKGYIGATLYNHSGSPVFIAPGTRFAHFVMADAETLHKYTGEYSHDKSSSSVQAKKKQPAPPPAKQPTRSVKASPEQKPTVKPANKVTTKIVAPTRASRAKKAV